MPGINQWWLKPELSLYKRNPLTDSDKSPGMKQQRLGQKGRIITAKLFGALRNEQVKFEIFTV